MEQNELIFLNQYETNLQNELISMCSNREYLSGQLLSSPDIDDKWTEMAPAYIADAIKEIAQYPTVALGWAMYLGMAIARLWDDDWQQYAQVNDLYEQIRDKRGFDYMDEMIREDILGVKGVEYDQVESIVRACSEAAHDAIRHEQIEPQSPIAFHVYARSVKTLYKIGAAIELKQLGYKLEKVD